MKKRILYITAAIVIIAVIAITYALLHTDGNNISAVLYYPDKSVTTLVSERESIAFDDPAHIPLNIINAIKEKGGINKNCNVNTVSFDSAEEITVDFTKEFLEEDSRVNLLRAYAIVKSICSTSAVVGITNVKITVAGKPITASDGKKTGYLSDSSINIMNSSEIMTYECNLYFQNKNGELQAETSYVDAANGTVEHNIVTALMNGPESKELSHVFVPGTTLISAETLNGICYVNFGKLPGGTDYNAVMSSLIYTLSELDGIDDVKILENGKTLKMR